MKLFALCRTADVSEPKAPTPTSASKTRPPQINSESPSKELDTVSAAPPKEVMGEVDRVEVPSPGECGPGTPTAPAQEESADAPAPREVLAPLPPTLLTSDDGRRETRALLPDASFRTKVSAGMADSHAAPPPAAPTALPPLKAPKARAPLQPLSGNPPLGAPRMADPADASPTAMVDGSKPQRLLGAPKHAKRRPNNQRKGVSWVENTIREFRERSPLDASARHMSRTPADEEGGDAADDDVVTFSVVEEDSPPPSTVLRAAREAVEDDPVVEDGRWPPRQPAVRGTSGTPGGIRA